MKKAWFDGRLYLQGLKRLRVIGLALAILCITVSILVPTTRWLDGPIWTGETRIPLDGDEVVLVDQFGTLTDLDKLVMQENKDDYRVYVEPIADRKLIVPVTVASYLSPVLVLIMFAFLNKRKESDFYHAIPYTRSCVFISFVAALLTWMWGVLTVSALASALIWGLCPFVSFSFGGLVLQWLYACLNATLLAAFTTVAVSLTGTVTTSIVTTVLIIASWRSTLYIVYEGLRSVLNIMQPEYLLGGYLKADFLLPVAIINGRVSTGKVIYAAVVTLLLFALGGWLYNKRNSEAAGYSITGKFTHILLRSLMSLPLALLVALQLVDKGEFVTFVILVVCTLLVFYLYELLTTKSLKSMLKATPWLGVLVGACIVFTGVIHVHKSIEAHERTDADRIKAVELLQARTVSGQQSVINQYEASQILGHMSRDPELIDHVAQAWAQTQKSGGYSYGYGGEKVDVRIKLNSGRTVVRRLRLDGRYAMMLLKLQKELNTKEVPDDEVVTNITLRQDYAGSYVQISGQWQSRVLEALRRDYEDMSAWEKSKTIDYSNELLRLSITTQEGEKSSSYSYPVITTMKHTMALMYELHCLPAYGRIAAAKQAIRMAEGTRAVTIGYYDIGEYREVHSIYLKGEDYEKVSSILFAGIARAEDGVKEGDRSVMYIMTQSSALPNQKYSAAFPIRLTQNEAFELHRILGDLQEETGEESEGELKEQPVE